MEMNTMADWEKWAKLAREDPKRFEKERIATIEGFIMSQPVRRRHRSRQLQWKIDAVRRTSPNSLFACVQLYEMLMDSVYGPRGLLAAIGLLGKVGGPVVRPAPPVRKKGLCLDLTKYRKARKGPVASGKQ